VRGSRVSKRYAQALFKEGKEKNKLDSLRRDMEVISIACNQSPEFRKLIDSPVIPRSAKDAAFSDAFQSAVDGMTLSFVQLLIQNGREHLLPEVIDFFGEILDNYDGIIRGEVQSVVPLTEVQLDELKSKLNKMTGKKVILTQTRDKRLIGGFVVKIEDRVIDASLRNQLSRMSEYLIDAH